MTDAVKPEVGMGATQTGWSDSTPYEIIEVSPSGKTITLRKMDAVIDPEWKPEMVVGGFAGHTTNNHSQRWMITPNPAGVVKKARMTKKGWHCDMGEVVVGVARKFYDYNF